MPAPRSTKATRPPGRKPALKTLLLLAALAALAFWLWTPDRSRRELEARYLAAPGDMRQVGAWRLHVRDAGPKAAPAVILVHGFASSLQTWDAWAAGLARDHRVIRFDLPGSGLSPPDPAGDYRDVRSMALLVTLMDSLGVARASIVGHSIGGRIAWTFAATHPDRVDKLVLVDPDGFASPGFAYGTPAEVPAVLGAMRYVLPKPLLRMNLRAAYADPALPDAELTTRYHDLMLAPGSREALLDRLRQTVLVDPVPLLKSIKSPVLLVWGERDEMIPIANAEDYRRAIPTARLTTIAGAGHLPQEEKPDVSLQAVRDFLR